MQSSWCVIHFLHPLDPFSLSLYCKENSGFILGIFKVVLALDTHVLVFFSSVIEGYQVDVLREKEKFVEAVFDDQDTFIFAVYNRFCISQDIAGSNSSKQS